MAGKRFYTDDDLRIKCKQAIARLMVTNREFASECLNIHEVTLSKFMKGGRAPESVLVYFDLKEAIFYERKKK